MWPQWVMVYRGIRKPCVRVLNCLMMVALLSGCQDSLLYSALAEQSAVEVEAALLTAGIDVRKKPAGDGANWTLTVPREDLPRAVALLRDQGLPRIQNPSMGDVFKKEGFVSSPLEERARYLYALSQELSQTLMLIDGVVSARVHVALPDRRPLDDSQRSASASVAIIQEPDIDLSHLEIDIKAIITDGIEGLDDVNRVTVKFFSRRHQPASQLSEQPLPERPPRHTLVPAGIAASLMLAVGGVGGMGAFMLGRRRRKEDSAQ